MAVRPPLLVERETNSSMHYSWSHNSAIPQHSALAWTFSLALHGGIFLALVLAWERMPRGAIEEPIRSAGIVLKRNSASGPQFEGESELAYAASSTGSRQPPESDPATPQEPVAPSTSLSADAGPTIAMAPAAPDDEAQTGAPNDPGGARGGSPGGDDRYAKVSVFGVQGTGNRFIYVFDRSSSMEGAPLSAAKRQLLESLSSLNTVHQFHIIFFNHRLRSFDLTSGGQRIAFGTERNKRLAANFVGGITADGGTDRFAALKQALAYRPDVIFFLTDADDPMSASELTEIERIYSRLGSAICVIEFGRTATPPQRNFLTELAGRSGGQYGYVNTAKLRP